MPLQNYYLYVKGQTGLVTNKSTRVISVSKVANQGPNHGLFSKNLNHHLSSQEGIAAFKWRFLGSEDADLSTCHTHKVSSGSKIDILNFDSSNK